jgi:uncharacterized protein YigE (DUF2233 family)
MVMADDVTSVNTTQRERISDIVNRSPYQDQEAVVAINADYFGESHGPEGLTVKNGRRLDGGGGVFQNPNAVWRSSLAISRLNQVSLGRKSVEDLNDPRAYQERFYNAVGGGPLILSHGVVIPNAVACVLERFPIGACRRQIQTAAGLSEDGRWLYLAVGEGRDTEGFARLLRDYGAFTAIKLDGGGSSQLWYNGQMRHNTRRAVGNALLVFYSVVPRHDAYFTELADISVAEPGQRVRIDFETHNSGYLDWAPELGYRFKNVQGWPMLGPAYQRLPEPVPSGGVLSSSMTIVTPQRPGVYEMEWQLVRRAEPIGSRLSFSLVVVPSGSTENGFKEETELWLAEQRGRSVFEDNWLALRRELEEEIWHEVEAQLRTALDDDWSTVEIPEWWWRTRRPLSW